MENRCEERKVRRVESWLGAFGQFVRATNSDYLATVVSDCFVLNHIYADFMIVNPL